MFSLVFYLCVAMSDMHHVFTEQDTTISEHISESESTSRGEALRNQTLALILNEGLFVHGTHGLPVLVKDSQG